MKILFRRLFCTFLLLCSAFCAFAATYYWIGGASGDWDDGDNWSLTAGGLSAGTWPGALATYDSVNNLASATTITLSSAVNTEGLVLGAGTELIIASGGALNNQNNSTIEGTLTIQSGGAYSESGILTNAGTGNITNDGSVASNNGITNNGSITTSGTFTTTTALTNNGTGTLTNSGTITAPNGITNAGSIANTGSLDGGSGITNTGSIQNTGGGSITGTVSGGGTVTGLAAWTGAVDSDWSNLGNWSNVASLADLADEDITISSGVTYYPIISTTAQVKSLTVDSGASLTISGNLTVSSLVSNGTLTATTGTVTFSGTSLWSGSDTLGSVVIDSGSTLTLGSNVSIAGDWTNNGTVVTSGNSLTVTGSVNQSIKSGAGTYDSVVFDDGGKTGGTVTFTDKLTVDTFTNAGTDAVPVVFSNGCAITNDVTFGTSGTVTLNGVCTFADDVTHTAGLTSVVGTVTADNVSLGAVNITGSLLPSGTLEAGAVSLATGSALSLGGALTLNGNWTDSGATFDHNGNAVTVTNTAIITGNTEFDDFTATGLDLTINGNTKFKDFTVAGSGGKTLTINGNIETSGTLNLSGSTGVGNELIITGNAGSSIKISSSQMGGEFLNVANTATPAITGGAYTAKYSTPTASSNNWLIFSGEPEYKWTGATNTDWGTATNWEGGFVPPSNTDAIVVIPNGATQYPVLSSNLTFGKLTVSSGATLDCASHTMAIGDFICDGTLRFSHSTATQITATTKTYTAATIEYYGNSPCHLVSDTVAPGSYANLKVTGTATTLLLDNNSINVTTSLSNEGTIEINGSGTLSGAADPDSGTITYSYATGGNLPSFGFFNLKISGGTWTTSAALSAHNNITVSSGKLAAGDVVSAKTITVSGGELAANTNVTASDLLTVTSGSVTAAANLEIETKDITLSGAAPCINTGANALTITGTSGTSIFLGADSATGLSLSNNELSRITSSSVDFKTTGTGDITVDSVAPAATTNCKAVKVVASGDVTIKGTNSFSDNFTASQSAGIISVSNAASITATGKNVELAPFTANSTFDITAGSFTLTNAADSTAAGNISLTADTIDLGGKINAGTHSVTIKPATSTRPISLGAETAGQLSLGNTELENIVSESVTIGSNTTTGAITVANSVSNTSMTKSVTLTNATGGITVNNALAFANANELVLSTTGSVTGTGAISVKSDGTGTLDVSAGTGISLANATGQNAAVVILKNTASNDITYINNHACTISAANSSGAVSLTNKTGTTEINGIKSAAGSNITIASASAVTQKSGTSAAISGNGVLLNGTSSFSLNNASNAFKVLASATGTGAITVVNNADLKIDSVGSVDGITSSGAVSVDTNGNKLVITKPILAAGFLQSDAAAGVELGADITIQTATGNVNFANSVTLSNDAKIETLTSNGDVDFSDTVNGAHKLEVKAGTGTVTFVGAVGATTELVELNIGSGTVSAQSIAAATINNSGTLTATTVTITSALTNTGTFTTTGLVDIKPSGTQVEITGLADEAKTTFASLSCKNQNGKTLKISNKITVSGTLELSGTAAGKLTITGDSGSGIKLTTSQTNGKYLDVADTATPAIVNAVYTAQNSTTATIGIVDGWNIIDAPLTFVWNGSSSTDWGTASNWNTHIVPILASDVIIPAIASGTYPSLTSAVTVGNTGTITVESTAKMTFNGNNVTAGTITNDGTLYMTGAETINCTTKSNGTDTASCVEYSGAVGTLPWGNSYTNLVFTAGAHGTVGGALTVSQKTTVDTGTGKDLSLSSTTNNFTGGVTVLSGGAVLLAAPDAIPGFTLAAGATCASLTVNGAVTLAGDVTTTGAQDYNGKVTLGAGATVTLTGGSDKLVTFNDTLTGDSNDLTIDVANVTFNGTVDTIAKLSAKVNATFVGAVGSSTPLTQIEVTGTANVNTASITTTGAQDYKDIVKLGKDVVFTANTGSAASMVTFDGTVDSSGAPGFGATFGSTGKKTNVTFKNIVGSTTALKQITVNGETAINTTAITTSETQDYNGAVTLGAGGAVTLTGGSGELVTFSDSLTGNGKDLTIADADVTFSDTVDTIAKLSAKVNATFVGAVGGTTPLTQIEVTGTANVNTTKITTTSTQDYKGKAILGKDVVFTAHNGGTASTVTFEETVDSKTGSGFSATFGDGTNATDVTFNKDVGGTTALTQITVNGETNVNTTKITTTGTQDYKDIVTLSKDVVFTANNGSVASMVTFDGTVDSSGAPGFGATFGSTGKKTNVTFKNIVGSTTALKQITVNGETAINTTAITTSETQDYNGAVTLGAGAAVTLTGGSGKLVTFNDALTGDSNDLTIDVADVTFDGTVDTIAKLSAKVNATFGAAVGGTTPLTQIEVIGTANVNTTKITTTGTQDYKGKAILGKDVVFTAHNGGTASTVTFEETVDSKTGSGFSATFGDGTHATDVTFKDKVGGTTALTKIEVSGVTNVDAASITTTSTQKYVGVVNSDQTVVTLNSTASSGGGLTFDSTVFAGTTGKTLVLNCASGTVEQSGAITADNLLLSGAATYNLSLTAGNNISVVASKVGTGTINLVTSGDLSVGAITVDGITTEGITSKGSVTIDTTTDKLTISQPIEAVEKITQKNGTAGVFLGANVSTTGADGDISFANDVTLSSSATVKTTGTNSDIVFMNNVLTSVANGTLTVTNTGVCDFRANIAFTGTSSKIVQNGSGKVMFGGDIGVRGGVSCSQDVYWYGNTNRTISDGTFSVDTDLHVAPTGTVAINAPITANNILLYSGTLTMTAGIKSVKDIVILGSSYKIDDDAIGVGGSGVTGLLSYVNTLRPKSANTTLATAFPLTTGYPTFPTTYSATLSTSNNSVCTVGENLYMNGTTVADVDFKIHNTSNSTSRFAEAHYTTVSNSTITCLDSGYYAWIAAAEHCTNNGGNSIATHDSSVPPLVTSGYAFNRPQFKTNDPSKNRGAEGSGIYTVYDDVIRIEICDSSGNILWIENSNNEITAALTSMKLNNNALDLSGAFTDADCTTSTNGKGDIKSFYIRANGTWNTDATGTSAGNAQSTNRQGAHKTVVPDITLTRALSTLYATLRDEYKNRICDYSGTRFTATVDRCDPVLVGVYTGQEAHTAHDGSAGGGLQPYDAHNFVELVYSEEVKFNAGTLGGVAVPAILSTDQNIPVLTVLGKTENVSGGGLNFEGLVKTASGMLYTGSRSSAAVAVITPDDPLVHSLYRQYSVDGTSAVSAQTHRIRLGIAAYTDGLVSFESNQHRFWPGYINSEAGTTQSPTGNVTRIANSCVTDTAGNVLTITGTTNHSLPQLTVQNTVSSLYSPWDVTPPDVAAIRTLNNDWDDPLVSYEIVPMSGADPAFIGRFEFHFFDSIPKYSAADPYCWRSMKGWYPKGDPDNFVYPTPESIGGARPFALSGNTAGGIRSSSLINAASSFSAGIAAGALTNTNFTAFTLTVNSMLFDPSGAGMGANVDTPYLSLLVNNPSAWQIQEQMEIAYSTATSVITDLAGNSIKSFGRRKCIDKQPPEFVLSFAAAIDTGALDSGIPTDELLLLFSEPIDQVNLDVAFIITGADGNPIPVVSNSVAIYNKVRPFGKAIRLKLARSLTVQDILHGKIAVVPHTYVDSYTGVTMSGSLINDEMGNSMVSTAQHRMSDFAINIIDVLYAMDRTDVTDGDSLTLQTGAIRDFDGSRRLHDEDITVAVRVNDTTTHGTEYDDISLIADHDVSGDGLPDKLLELTSPSGESSLMLSRLWLPSPMESYASAGNTNSLFYTQTPVGDTRLLNNYVLPKTAPFNEAGNELQFLFKLTYGPGATDFLYCARLSDPSDLGSVDVWRFDVSKNKKQRGGVTILNNVINSLNGEETILHIDVPESGRMTVQVFTLDGNIVDVLYRGSVTAGEIKKIPWNGTNRGGRPVARGIYFIRVVGPDIDEIRKVMVVK